MLYKCKELAKIMNKVFPSSLISNPSIQVDPDCFKEYCYELRVVPNSLTRFGENSPILYVTTRMLPFSIYPNVSPYFNLSRGIHTYLHDFETGPRDVFYTLEDFRAYCSLIALRYKDRL
jgi:hypothetical protein